MSENTASTQASGPTVMLSGSAPSVQPQTNLVLGFGRDEASNVALGVAHDLADRLHAYLAVVHIVNLGDYPIDSDSPDWERQARLTLDEERSRVQRVLVDYRFGWSYEARYGLPVDVLLQVAEERDAFLIVVGRHGHGMSEGLRRLIDGSVSHRLMKRGARPVLVVPSGAAAKIDTTA